MDMDMTDEGVATGKYQRYQTKTPLGQALVYAMPDLKQSLEAPTEWYADKIRQGYRDWCLSLDHLESVISAMPARKSKWDAFDWGADYYTRYSTKQPFKANKTNYKNISTDQDRIATKEWNKRWAMREG